jgi:hypothetical protein
VGRARQAKEISYRHIFRNPPPGRFQAVIAPSAMRSLPQNMTVGVSGDESISRTADAPASTRPLSSHRSSWYRTR